MKTFIKAVGWLCFVCWFRAQAQVLTGPITNMVNGHSYYLLAPTNWAAAEAQAVNLGGHLATINDDEENTWVYTTFANYCGQPRALWIGLSDAAQEGFWVWNDANSSPYRHWAPGEPNNGGGYYPNEDQAVIRNANLSYAGFWNDAPEEQKHCAVVEIAAPPAPFSGVVSGPITNPLNDHQYYLLAPTNWQAAESMAISLGGHLATINNAGENNWVFTNFNSYGSIDVGLWLGLNDSAQEGTFIWCSGVTAAYRNWAPGEPNNGAGFYPYENHGLMRLASASYNGFWNDAIDTQKHFGLAEVPSPQVVKAMVKISVVDLCWPAVTNGVYQLQYRTNTTTSPWMNIGIPILGTGLEMCTPIDMPAGKVQKYYRVLRLQ